MSVFCILCTPPTRHEDEAVAQHMLDEHDFDLQAAMAEVETWPDGGVVVHVEPDSLTPEGFS